MEGSGTGTVAADAVSLVILWGLVFLRWLRPWAGPAPPGGVGGHQPHVTAAVLPPGGPEDHLARLPRDVNGTRLITPFFPQSH